MSIKTLRYGNSVFDADTCCLFPLRAVPDPAAEGHGAVRGSGQYNKHKEDGVYNCAGCGTPLYTSETKFDSGCGWCVPRRALVAREHLHYNGPHIVHVSVAACLSMVARTSDFMVATSWISGAVACPHRILGL